MALIELEPEAVRVKDCGFRRMVIYALSRERVLLNAVRISTPESAAKLAAKWAKRNPFRDYAPGGYEEDGEKRGVIFIEDSPLTEDMLAGREPIPYLGRRRRG